MTHFFCFFSAYCLSSDFSSTKLNNGNMRSYTKTLAYPWPDFQNISWKNTKKKISKVISIKKQIWRNFKYNWTWILKLLGVLRSILTLVDWIESKFYLLKIFEHSQNVTQHLSCNDWRGPWKWITSLLIDKKYWANFKRNLAIKSTRRYRDVNGWWKKISRIWNYPARWI